MSGNGFRLEAIRCCLAPPLPRARKTDLGGDTEPESQIRLEIGHSDTFERVNESRIHMAQSSLIDPRRVEKAVANHPGAARQGRLYGSAHVIVSSGCKQKRLRFRPERLCRTGHQHVSDR